MAKINTKFLGGIISKLTTEENVEIQEVCGVKGDVDPDISFIVRGQDAKIEEFPWAAALTSQHKKAGKTIFESCTATIISKKHLITAAHCFYEINQDSKGE